MNELDFYAEKYSEFLQANTHRIPDGSLEYYSDRYEMLVDLWSPEIAFTRALDSLIFDIYFEQSGISPAPGQPGDQYQYYNFKEVLETVFEGESLSPELTDKIVNGELHPVDVIAAGVASDAPNSLATPDKVEEWIKQNGNYVSPTPGGVTPEPEPEPEPEILLFDIANANFAIDGLSDEGQDFLMAMYLGAFSRAPDIDGVLYWADRMKDVMAEGGSLEEAAAYVSTYFYAAGVANNENGTNASNREFVEMAYDSLLARTPDTEGWDYWTDMLDAGQVERSDFLLNFVSAALEDENDASRIELLIGTAEFYTQQHVTGSDASIDIALLDRVTDIRSEQDAAGIILEIAENYGVADHQQIDVVGLNSFYDAY